MDVDIFDNNPTLVSLDTSTLKNHKFNLGNHLYQSLAELSSRGMKLVLTDVVYGEIIEHMAKDMETLYSSLSGELPLAAYYFAHDEHTAQQIKTWVKSVSDFKALAQKRIDEYLHRCKGVVLKADDWMQTGEVLDLYFAIKPPFEANIKKRYEFKDAIALKTLEAFSNDRENTIYIASADSGWEKFCANARYMKCMNLRELIGHIQRQSGEYENFISQITAQLFDTRSSFYQNVQRLFAIAITDYSPDIKASTVFYYEEKIASVALNALNIPESTINIIDINEAGCTFSVPVQADLLVEVLLDIYPNNKSWMYDADLTLLDTVKRNGHVDFVGTIEIILKGNWQNGFATMTLDEVIYDYDYTNNYVLDCGELDAKIRF
ncbi:DUF4935 domain-containing protein [Enterobacteriaceae bacterium 4M9]|nr:DUF4935 domain-containing protein [Enterobacteriaceae bacterium 4M9]